MSNRYLGIPCAILIVTIISACGGAPAANEQASLRATVEAEVRATMAAQAPPTEAPSPTVSPLPATATPAPTTPPTPTSAPVEPTRPPFAPAADTPSPSGASAAATAAPAEDVRVVFRPQEQTGTGPTVNIQLVFDASGSMAQRIGGETKIQAARRAMERVIESLPDNPNLNVGFRVFGHEGDSSEAQRARSCQSTALLVPVQGVNKALLRQQALAWEPAGWTPISLALQRAGEDLKAGENVRNVIIMVSDGEETCDGDPCAVAAALAASEAEVRIDVVGFGLEPQVAQTLRCITENSGGRYIDAQNGDALAQTLEELIAASLKRSTLRFIAIGPDGKPAQVSLSGFRDAQGKSMFGARNPETDKQIEAAFEGEQLIALPPGEYRFTVFRTEGRADQVRDHYFTDYTAIIEEGRETVAVIGWGSVTFINDGLPATAFQDLRVEKLVDGAWETSIFTGSTITSREGTVGFYFEFDAPYVLAPGRYRVYDTKRRAVVVDNIVVEPGKSIMVRLRP